MKIGKLSFRILALRLIFLLLFLILANQSYSQRFAFDWLKHAGGESWDLASDIIVDNDKNILLAGSFTGTAYFGEDSITSIGDRDIFVAKYDSTGNQIFLIHEGGKSYENVMDIELDNSGNIYLAGNFMDTTWFDNQFLVSDIYINNYITKYSSTGDLIWVKKISADTRANPLKISVMDDNSIIYSGSFNDYIIFDSDTLHSVNGSDIFSANYSSAGELISYFIFDGLSNEKLTDFRYSDDFVYFTGSFSDSLTLADTIFYSYGEEDVFICKSDILGDIQWLRQGAGFGNDKIKQMIFDQNNNLILCGDFNDNIYFESDSLITNGVSDVFVAKYSNSGDYLWSRNFGGTMCDYSYTVFSNSFNDVYVSGTFKGTISVNSDSIVSEDYKNDMFIAKYSDNGLLKWFSQSGGSDRDFVNKIISMPDNYFYIIGSFGSDFAVETDTVCTDSIVDAFQDDILFARFYDCDNADILITENDTTFCGAGSLTANSGFRRYVWNTGRRFKTININNSGDYWLTAIDRHNCPVESDTVSVVVNPTPEPDLGNDLNVEQGQYVQLYGGTFTTYLWSTAETDTLATTETAIISTEEMEGTNTVYLTVTNELNCPGNDEIMLFVATPSYANNNENYQNQAVYQNVNDDYFSEELNPNVTIVQNPNTESQNSVLKTENSITVTQTNSTMCYPNPSKGGFTVSLTNIELEPNSTLEIFTTDGKQVYERNNVETQTINITLTSKGVHYVKITSGDKIYSEEIVLQ